ncbi:YceH family protein [Crenobacter intestini]|uniref:DUF480 domain-containing protein n=1 Tax=Crenobacter intestini TaxID=2563443 RepID=A0A4V4N8X4_9NEIS|nr:DUF480 domain-containing protein [Crenobacter intestini]TIC86153.1 DUF480 domain-containing protein [Crenobacter intestini]
MDAYELDPVDVRVLGCLVEKQALTPDNYPLTRASLLAACNQSTSREPVMSLGEAELSASLDRLLARRLIGERMPAGSRVAKYEHRLGYEWNVDGAKLAALALLMLRGAQTPAEIRARAGRIHTFASADVVETALSALADKYPPLVVHLPRQAGEREARWAHLLCGEPVAETAASAVPDAGCDAIVVGLTGRVAALEAEVAALKARVAELEGALVRD